MYISDVDAHTLAVRHIGISLKKKASNKFNRIKTSVSSARLICKLARNILKKYLHPNTDALTAKEQIVSSYLLMELIAIHINCGFIWTDRMNIKIMLYSVVKVVASRYSTYSGVIGYLGRLSSEDAFINLHVGNKPIGTNRVIRFSSYEAFEARLQEDIRKGLKAIRRREKRKKKISVFRPTTTHTTISSSSTYVGGWISNY